jgi:hypothetical protein
VDVLHASNSKEEHTMKRTAYLFTLGLVVLALAAGCVGTPASGGTPPEHALNVMGEGTVEVTPDVATATLGVETRNVDVAEAVGENISRAQAVTEALKAAGILEKDIQTAGFSVYAQDQFDQAGQPTGARIYVVSNTVTFIARDIPKVGDVLSAALKAGANTVNGVSFSIEDPTVAMAEARLKAMEDAKARATALADSAGVTLGKPISINESYAMPVTSFATDKAMGLGGGGAPVPVSAGSLTVTVQVSIAYAIK